MILKERCDRMFIFLLLKSRISLNDSRRLEEVQCIDEKGPSLIWTVMISDPSTTMMLNKWYLKVYCVRKNLHNNYNQSQRLCVLTYLGWTATQWMCIVVSRISFRWAMYAPNQRQKRIIMTVVRVCDCMAYTSALGKGHLHILQKSKMKFWNNISCL